MNGFYLNIEEDAAKNNNFRKVLYTGENLQLVLMSLLPGENIGMETHDNDQFVRVEEGKGRCVIDGKAHNLSDGDAIIIPAGAEHDVEAGPKSSLKIYVIYAPPKHKDGEIYRTKDLAEENDEEFDGETTEEND